MCVCLMCECVCASCVCVCVCVRYESGPVDYLKRQADAKILQRTTITNPPFQVCETDTQTHTDTHMMWPAAATSPNDPHARLIHGLRVCVPVCVCVCVCVHTDVVHRSRG